MWRVFLSNVPPVHCTTWHRSEIHLYIVDNGNDADGNDDDGNDDDGNDDDGNDDDGNDADHTSLFLPDVHPAQSLLSILASNKKHVGIIKQSVWGSLFELFSAALFRSFF